MTQEKLPDNLRESVKRVVADKMGPFGLERVDVDLGPDHDGETAVIINAYYRPVQRSVDSKTLAQLLSLVRSDLWQSGEERFPYIRHHFEEKVAQAG